MRIHFSWRSVPRRMVLGLVGLGLCLLVFGEFFGADASGFAMVRGRVLSATAVDYRHALGHAPGAPFGTVVLRLAGRDREFVFWPGLLGDAAAIAAAIPDGVRIELLVNREALHQPHLREFGESAAARVRRFVSTAESMVFGRRVFVEALRLNGHVLGDRASRRVANLPVLLFAGAVGPFLLLAAFAPEPPRKRVPRLSREHAPGTDRVQFVLETEDWRFPLGGLSARKGGFEPGAVRVCTANHLDLAALLYEVRRLPGGLCAGRLALFQERLCPRLMLDAGERLFLLEGGGAAFPLPGRMVCVRPLVRFPAVLRIELPILLLDPFSRTFRIIPVRNGLSYRLDFVEGDVVRILRRGVFSGGRGIVVFRLNDLPRHDASMLTRLEELPELQRPGRGFLPPSEALSRR